MTDPFATQNDPFASSTGDPFGDPARMGKMPKMIELKGRLLLLTPKSIETVANTMEPGKTQDRLTTDLVILDGTFPIVRLDGHTGQPVPNEEPLEAREYERMWISNVAIVNACRKSVAGTGSRMILGRLVQAPQADKKRRPAWILQDATEADKVVARTWLAQNAEPAF